MADYEIIDAHVHTYKTPEIGIQAMGGTPKCHYSGTIEDTLKAMATAGISKSVMVNFTPVPDMREAALARLPKDLSASDLAAAKKRIDDDLMGRVVRRNEWSCDEAKANPGLIAFVGVDPTMSAEAMAAEIEDKVKNWGAKGVKVHPPIQYFFADDRVMWPAYEKAQELGVPVLFHSGEYELPNHKEYSRTKLFASLLAAFPKLTVVLAHLGNHFFEETLDLAKRFPNAHFDSSAVLSVPESGSILSNAHAVALIRSIGVERVLFGSDFPWYAPEVAVERLESLPLTKEEKRLIGAENAKRILSL